ncbi:DUF429 domain-containing protein [Halorubrum sp. Boch-26]|uniref:DUF429 domain-containing protein n=1 Tax=Halorubrum sp. Boch-26 TaxID=2994426 RepID=UPI00246987E3|nr:DUF429 domain-containing protein [Halorubrum sp. Boch-26]
MDRIRDDGGFVRAGGDPVRVHGVDFSAAANDAGRKTWIASGTIDAGSDELLVTELRSLAELTGLDDDGGRGAGREDALPALAAWIRTLDERAVVGADFPFGLPRFVAEETGNESWRSVISEFPESIGVGGAAGGAGERDDGGDGDEPDGTGDPVRAFAERCVGLTERYGEGTYDKRRTDAAVGARSPYGFIADTIAFYGMRDVLAPVADDVRFAPMDLAGQGWRPEAPPGPTVVETYPAAVLDRLGLCRTNYKGGGESAATRRRRNAEGLVEEAAVVYKSGTGLADSMVADAGGDALDAVAACVGAFGAWERSYETDAAAFDDPDAVALEGYIYA